MVACGRDSYWLFVRHCWRCFFLTWHSWMKSFIPYSASVNVSSMGVLSQSPVTTLMTGKLWHRTTCCWQCEVLLRCHGVILTQQLHTRSDGVRTVHGNPVLEEMDKWILATFTVSTEVVPGEAQRWCWRLSAHRGWADAERTVALGYRGRDQAWSGWPGT